MIQLPVLEELAVLFSAAMRAEQSQAGAMASWVYGVPYWAAGMYGVAGGGGLLPNAWPCMGASIVV